MLTISCHVLFYCLHSWSETLTNCYTMLCCVFSRCFWNSSMHWKKKQSISCLLLTNTESHTFLRIIVAWNAYNLFKWQFSYIYIYIYIYILPSKRILIPAQIFPCQRKRYINPLTPNDPYRGRTAPLTSKRCILNIYSTNIGTEYFKHDVYSPFFFLQNAVCFIILTYLVPVLFTFYIQDVLKLKRQY